MVEEQKRNSPNPRYNQLDNVAVSYYRMDERRSIWVYAPFKEDFLIEEPYQGDDRFAIKSNKDNTFNIPFLRLIKTSEVTLVKTKNKRLMAVLWVRDHRLYTDQLVKSSQEFYRCVNKRGTEENYWILIPLYSRTYTKQVRFPVWTYNAENFRNTIIIKNPDIYDQLVQMFSIYYLNYCKVVINEKMKWLVQFTDAPALFLL